MVCDQPRLTPPMDRSAFERKRAAILAQLSQHTPRARPALSIRAADRVRTQMAWVIGCVGGVPLAATVGWAFCPTPIGLWLDAVLVLGLWAVGTAVIGDRLAQHGLKSNAHGGVVGVVARWWLGQQGQDEPILPEEAGRLMDVLMFSPQLTDIVEQWAARNEACAIGRSDYYVFEAWTKALDDIGKRCSEHERNRKMLDVNSELVLDILNKEGLVDRARIGREKLLLTQAVASNIRADTPVRRM